jgi:hypothetical protein
MTDHPHIIFQICSEYNLTDEKELSARILKLGPDDWARIVDTMEKWYQADIYSAQQNISTSTPLTFTFPALPTNLLNSLSKYLLIGDAVWFDDPLYDSLCLLEAYKNCDDFKKYSTLNLAFQHTLSAVETYIRFYAKAKNLVEAGKLIPYKNMVGPAFPRPLANAVFQTLFQNKGLLRELGIRRSFLRQKLLPELVFLIRPLFLRVVRNLETRKRFGRSLIKFSQIDPTMDNAFVAFPIFFSLLYFFLYPPPGSSSDLLTSDFARLYRMTLDLLCKCNDLLPPERKLVLPIRVSLTTPQILLIDNVPLERIIDAYEMEREALDHYRYSLNEKLLQITAPPGSLEREREIARIKESIQKDVSGISIAFKTINNTYRKRLTLSLLLSAMGVSVTGVGTSAQNLDVLSIAASAAGASAVVAGIKDILKDWQDYKRDVNLLHSRENFLIWKFHSNLNG